ncbi:MAG: hypothetical protein O6944_04595 [Gammaproteobacteria bacterium]|nr:hypothetical protein [Gammaproteobacteria bacterium]
MVEGSIDRDFFKVAAPSPWKPWIIASVAALAILGIAVALMNSVGLFEIPEDDPGAKTIAAAIALIGTVLSATMALVGTVVKYSIDDRNSRLAAVEASHNYALAVEAEKRNRIEAAIRAVDLLGENNADATGSQIGGAMLALVSLGEVSLATALLSQLWPSGLAAPTVAEIVIAEALKTGSEDTQRLASVVLYKNADQIQQAGFHIWPISDPGWDTELPGNARLSLALAAAHWLVSDLKSGGLRLPSGAAVLYQALNDPDDIVKDIAASSLKPLIQKVPETAWIYTDQKRLTAPEIAARLTQFPDEPLTSHGVQVESDIRELLEPSDGESGQTS